MRIARRHGPLSSLLWALLLALVAGCGGAPTDSSVKLTHYEAKHMAGLLQRAVILAQDPAANRCVRILLVSRDYEWLPHLDIDLQVPEGWAIENAEITDDVADCDFEGGDVPPPPRGASAQAIAGSGSIEQRPEYGDSYYGVVGIHATLSFDTDGDFPPVGVALDADDLRMPSP